ncbi:hypothetical protein Egran_02045 [Elaphomyces granulatus]|uniref:Thiamine-binding protein domain-containing protein n=1 Tax=Elaphomyces granulatus TaxID=519963 RepID=A0A232M1K3_9EURO|nr:hypothetical protein Egran_02045 [Elaphomyces granulatus]
MATINTTTLVTPTLCTADFSLIPIDSKSTSYSQQIADVQRLIQKSGLKFMMHSTGTTLGMSTVLRSYYPGCFCFTIGVSLLQRWRANYEWCKLMYIIIPYTEGPWDQVAQVIGWAHSLIHQQGIARIQTDIRISTRTDKVQSMEGNVAAVERILAATI